MNDDLILGLFTRWKAKYAHNTLYTFVGVLRRFLRFLETHGAPPIKVPHVSGPRSRPNTATPEQMQQLVGNAAPWLRLFILLCWQTALRFHEAWRVTPRSYNAQTNTVSIVTKGGKQRAVEITPDVYKLMAPTLGGDPDKPCIWLLKGGRCSPGAVRSAWCQLVKRLGILGVNPHDLRRTTLNRLYHVSGHDIRAVQQYAGHDRMTSTLHYLAPLKQDELRQYHRLLNFHTDGKPS